MILQFFGAAQTVTGSMHFLGVNGKRYLLDCGLFQGKRTDTYERNKNFPFDPASIDAVILSHAHIDHAGNLPNLVRNGFRGPIYTTNASRDLAGFMLYDSAYLQERDIEYVNKRHQKKHEPLVESLYVSDDVGQTLAQVVGVGYRQTISVGEGVAVQFFDAGHILGSAVMLLVIEEKGKTMRLGFTGDLGRKNMPILRDPQFIGNVDVLISESTYGGKVHEPITSSEDALHAVIQRTVDRGGKVIVPAFSVGRTQELVYAFFKQCDAGRLPPVPVFVDSPLAVNATEVFRVHPECFDKEMCKYILEHEDPFGFSRLQFIKSVEKSKALNDFIGPCIIISASGMCEGGRVLHHLTNTVGDPKNTVLIVGFMAEHTLGRRLAEKQTEVKIFGELHTVRAEIAELHSFSAHAGQDELVGYVSQFDRGQLSDVFLVHGELQQAEQFSQKLKEVGLKNVHIPVRGEKAEFNP